MKSYLKKISKKHILIVGFLCLILFIATAFAMIHTGESKASKVRTTQTTSKSSKKKESSNPTSSTSSSTSSQSSSESTSEAQQAEVPATQTEQQPQEQQEAPQQSVTPAQPSQGQIQQAQEQYGYTPGYGGYYPSDEEIADDQARQQWYDDQVQWGIEQGYIDPNTGDYTGQ